MLEAKKTGNRYLEPIRGCILSQYSVEVANLWEMESIGQLYKVSRNWPKGKISNELRRARILLEGIQLRVLDSRGVEGSSNNNLQLSKIKELLDRTNSNKTYK